MGDEENKVTMTHVREAFREESAGLLSKLETKPESKVVLHPQDEAKLAQEPLEDKADMRAPALGGVVGGLDGLRIPVLNLSIPIGSALVGGVIGMIIGDVIDIVMPPPLDSVGRQTFNLSTKSLINVGVQAAGAGVVLKWGPGVIGSGPAKFAAALMALRVILRVPAVQNLINRAGTAIAAPLSGVTVGQARANQGDVLAQAEAAANAAQVIYGEDYFKAAL